MLPQSLITPFNATTVFAALLATAPLVAVGQPAAGPNVLYVGKPPGDCAGPAGRKIFQLAGPGPGPAGGFVAGGMVVGMGPISKETPVTGKPYSASGTTETVQTLADGNRIVHTNTTQYFRDSKGRTRTEYTLSAVGPFTLDESRKLVLIDDSTSGKRYILHPELKRAESLPSAARVAIGSPNGPAMAVTMAASAIGPTAATTTPPCTAELPAPPAPVSLGQQMIEGLKASGTRVEHTIPAGEIGNELPITVSSEQWVSDELGVVLSSTQHDPMIGDTSYHVDHITRSEPDPALFTVPSDYVVEQPPSGKRITLIQRAAPAGSAVESK